MTPRISVIIPTYNRPQALRRCLDSLMLQRGAPPFEVIVVDDGSTPDTAAMLASFKSRYPLRVMWTPNAGPAAARNLGASEALGQYLLFVDDDVVAHPDLIAEHSAAHEEEANAVVFGPLMGPKTERVRSWVRWEQEVLDKQYVAMLEGQWRPTPRQFYTANGSVSAARFREAGGFDAAFKRAEDVELAYRLQSLGMRFVFRADAIVTHYAGRTLAGWWRIPYQYGVYDVRMWRDKGRSDIPEVIGREYYERNPLTQRAIGLAVGGGVRSRLVAGPAALLGALTGGLGAYGLARRLYSLAFNVMYYQGVCDELGSLPSFRSVLTNGAPAAERGSGLKA